MTVNSTGEQNRISGRDFNENHIQIDKFDSRHTINIAIPSGMQDKRPLVKAQRKELNTLVAAVSTICGGEAYEIWQKVHAEIGVSSIEEMTSNQYQAAISFLQSMIERGKDRDASKALVSLLLRNSEDSELRQKLIRYCHVNFGTGRLNDLTRSQLQMTLAWLDQYNSSTSAYSTLAVPPRLKIAQFLKAYPKEIGFIFSAGVIASSVIFLLFSN